MKNSILIILFGFTCLTSFGQDPIPPDELLNQDLRTWLKNNWYNPWANVLGYSEAREEMYSYIDNEGGQVYCVYSGYNQDSEFTSFLDPINCEHTVPQSYFGSAEPMKSDIHHLYPTHGTVNSARGNLPFKEISDTQTDDWWVGDESDIYEYNSIPSVSIESYSEVKHSEGFEPREEHKGDVARSVFYFYTMYPTQAGALSTLADQDILYQWHQDDPVDAAELLRDEKTQEVQGNYNPYVRMPELVEKAWGYFVIGIEEKSDFQTSIFPNPARNFVTVKIDNLDLNDASVEIISLDGKVLQINNLQGNELDISNLSNGIYILKTTLQNSSYPTILIVEK